MAKTTSYYYRTNSGKIGTIHAKSMDDLRRKAFVIMGNSKKDTMALSKYKSFLENQFVNTFYMIYNTYFGLLSKSKGEVYTENGMRAVDKSTGKLLYKTSI